MTGIPFVIFAYAITFYGTQKFASQKPETLKQANQLAYEGFQVEK